MLKAPKFWYQNKFKKEFYGEKFACVRNEFRRKKLPN